MRSRTRNVLSSSLVLLGLLTQGLGAQERDPRSTYRSFLEDPKLKEKEAETGERQDDAAGRIDWWRQRMGGEYTDAFKQRLVAEAEKERAKHPGVFLGDVNAPLVPAAVTGLTWSPIGPTSSNKIQNGIVLTKVDSGRARTILPDPTNPNTVYFLTSGGGLWKSTDFLSNPPTWTPLTDSVGSTSGGSAAFGGTHPGSTLNPNVLYVGFGDPFDGGVGGIIAKTSDGGGTFPAGTKVVLPGVSVICDVKVDLSQASDVVLVGTNAGLFRSTDGGSTYNKPSGSMSSGQIWSIVQTSAGWLASRDVSGTTSFFLSTDQGATWSASTTPSGLGRTTLGVGLPGDAVVYAFATTTNASAQKDLYRSTNGGTSWSATGTNSSTTPTNSNGDQGNNDYMHGQAFYNHMLLVDPTDATRNTVYVGGNLSTAKSTTGGASWTVLTNWLAQFSLQYAHADFHSAAFFVGSPNRIFFGSDGGLFVSTDGGTTFDDKKNKGLQTHLIYAMTCGFNGGADKNSVLIGLQDNGTRLRVGSTTVFDQTKGGDGFGVGWSQANNNWTLGSYVYNDIARCTNNPPDDQSKWADFTTGLGTTSSSNFYFVTPIIGAPASSDLTSANPGQNFYTYGNSTSGKIFTTAVNGTSWSTIGTPGSGGLSAGRFVRAESHGIGVSPVDLNHIAAAGNGGVALITTDGGTNWTERTIASLGVSNWPGFNSNIVWASNSKLYLCSVDTAAPSVPHVVKSIDGGASWTAAATGLPSVPVNKLAVDPGDATGETVYAATWLGLYRTTNGGTSWAPFGTGQPQGNVSDIYVAPDSSFLRISYYGRGVYQMDAIPVLGIALTSPAAPVTLVKGATQSYTATLTNFANSNVNWTVGAGGGTFLPTTTTTGAATVFTAGTTANTFTITATAAEDGVTNATQNVTVVDPTSVNVVVSPSAATVTSGATRSFSATVTPINNTAVTWSISPAVGSINASSGLYTAPATPPASAQAVTVTATSTAAPTRTGTATVTVPVLTISVSPTPVSVSVSSTQQFTTTVTGSTNTAVTWSIFSGVGSVNSAGLYTAPGSVGSAVVRATSVADPTKFADAAITVTPMPVSVVVTPNPTSMTVSTTKQFTATVSNAANTAVTWTVVEAGGGSISGTGLYTAPGTPGTYHVTATSVQDGTKSDTATVTVNPAVTISITPTEAWVQPNGSATFTGIPSAGGVSYSVTEGTIAGTITSGGVFTASSNLGNFQVVATSTVDTSKAAVAVVHIQPLVVSMTPANITLQVGTTQLFTPTVVGNPITDVTWSVVEGVSGGTVVNGLYTAPATPGTFHVRATSVLDATKFATSTVTVQSSPVLSVNVTPGTANLVYLGTQTFSATVTNGAQGVTWSVDEAGGGSIGSTSGLYTAPSVAGTYHVRATSTVDTTKSATATVTVTSPVSAFSVSPTSASVLSGGTVPLTGSVSAGTINWSASVGSFSATSGTSVTYTPPTASGTYTVTATASLDPAKTIAITIKVRSKDQDGSGGAPDVIDLAFIARYFGTNNPDADLNGDGIVDEADITLFLNGF